MARLTGFEPVTSAFGGQFNTSFNTKVADSPFLQIL